SSLIPCDACYRVQSLLRNTGDALKDLFQSEGLPSSLQPLSDAMQDTVYAGQMTAGDVAQWTEEQLRDMRRLAKHLQDVRSTVQPLREALAKAETERDKFSSQLESMKKEFKQEKVKTLCREEEKCCELQQMIQEIKTQLSDTQLLLDKEKAKYQSACRAVQAAFIFHQIGFSFSDQTRDQLGTRVTRWGPGHRAYFDHTIWLASLKVFKTL
ncbi:hypothetical protein GOODEAATRI_014108, partial [Goodea atripinnis]